MEGQAAIEWIIEPADQVAWGPASISLVELRAKLRSVGQDLPLPTFPDSESPPDWLLIGGGPTLKNALDLALPHGCEGAAGAWRDWILGATCRFGDRTVAKAGSRVVKSVAGYDLHRFLVGSRGELAEFLEVTLKTMPMAAVPESTAVRYGELASAEFALRTLRSDFEAQSQRLHGATIAADPATCTLWLSEHPGPVGLVWPISGACPGTAFEAKFMDRARRLLGSK